MLIPCIKTENAIIYPAEIMVSTGWVNDTILTMTDKNTTDNAQDSFSLRGAVCLYAADNLENTIDQDDSTDHINCHYICNESLDTAEK